MRDETGFQWLIDPSGHRWKIIGFNEVLANLEDANGGRINVGRDVLRKGLDDGGGWELAEFERQGGKP